MAKPKPRVPDEAIKPHETGVAYSVRAVSVQGFSNFEIVTFFVVNGQIVHTEATQPYATFEAIARLEVLISASTWNLSNHYQPGRLLRMGAEQRDDLVKRLSKEAKFELLERIKPAMGF